MDFYSYWLARVQLIECIMNAYCFLHYIHDCMDTAAVYANHYGIKTLVKITQFGLNYTG